MSQFNRQRTDIVPIPIAKHRPPSRKRIKSRKILSKRRKSSKRSSIHTKNGELDFGSNHQQKQPYYTAKSPYMHKIEPDETYITETKFKQYFQTLLTEIHSVFEQHNERITEVEMLSINMYQKLELLTQKTEKLETYIEQGKLKQEQQVKKKQQSDRIEPNLTKIHSNGLGKQQREQQKIELEINEEKIDQSPIPPSPILSPFSFQPERGMTVSETMKPALDDVESNLSTPRTPRENIKYNEMVQNLKVEMNSPISIQPEIMEDENIPQEEEIKDDLNANKEDSEENENEINQERNKNQKSKEENKENREEERKNEALIKQGPTTPQQTLETDTRKGENKDQNESETYTPETNRLDEAKPIMQNNFLAGKGLSSINTTPIKENLGSSSAADYSPFDLDSVMDTMTVLSDTSNEEERTTNQQPVIGNGIFKKHHIEQEKHELSNGEDTETDASVVYNDDSSEGSVFIVSDHEGQSPPVGTADDSSIEDEDLNEAERQRDEYRERFFSNSQESIDLAPYTRYVYVDHDQDADDLIPEEQKKGTVVKETMMICPALSRMLTSVLLPFGSLSSLASLKVDQTYCDMTIEAVILSEVYEMNIESALSSFGTGNSANRWLDWMMFNLCSRQFKFTYRDSKGTSYCILWDDFLNPQVTHLEPAEKPEGATDDQFWCEYNFFFIPHFLKLFGLSSLTKVHRIISHAILVEVAAVSGEVATIHYNGKPLPAQNLKDFAEYYWSPQKCDHIKISNKFHIVIATDTEADPMPISFVNAHLTINGGRHVKYVKKSLNRAALTKEARHQLKTNGTKLPNLIDHVRIFVSVYLDDPVLSPDCTMLKELKPRQIGRLSTEACIQLLQNIGIQVPISIDSLL